MLRRGVEVNVDHSIPSPVESRVSTSPGSETLELEVGGRGFELEVPGGDLWDGSRERSLGIFHHIREIDRTLGTTVRTGSIVFGKIAPV